MKTYSSFDTLSEVNDEWVRRDEAEAQAQAEAEAERRAAEEERYGLRRELNVAYRMIDRAIADRERHELRDAALKQHNLELRKRVKAFEAMQAPEKVMLRGMTEAEWVAEVERLTLIATYGKEERDKYWRLSCEHADTIDRLKAELEEARRLMARLDRGCDCEHDYRCYRCDAVVEAKEFATREGK